MASEEGKGKSLWSMFYLASLFKKITISSCWLDSPWLLLISRRRSVPHLSANPILWETEDSLGLTKHSVKLKGLLNVFLNPVSAFLIFRPLKPTITKQTTVYSGSQMRPALAFRAKASLLRPPFLLLLFHPHIFTSPSTTSVGRLGSVTNVGKQGNSSCRRKWHTGTQCLCC